MLQRKSSKDAAAFGLLLSVPIALLLLAFYAMSVWDADSEHNPRHPDYISPYARSSLSLLNCVASMNSRLGQFPTTNIYMPVVGAMDYITALASGGERHETTTWGLFYKDDCSDTSNGTTALPEPRLTVTLGPNTMTFETTE